MHYTAPRHGEAIIKALDNEGPIIIKQGQRGFWTSRGRHVNRKEALEIAVAAGQIEAKKITGCVLTSEELW